MIRKAFIIIVVTFFIQIIVSCICRCPDAVSYEINYNAVTITPYNTAGFVDKPVEDTVYRNAFGLTVSVNFEMVRVSQTVTNYSCGFSSAMACDCEGDEYLYPDPISHVDLYVIDVETNETKDVTSCFSTYDYGGNLISLEQFFSEREEWHDGFQFELVDFDSIPNSAIFVAEAYLQSGKMFTKQTGQINFY